MKIVATYKAAENIVETAAGVISCPKKKENIVLPSFVNNCLPPKEGESKLSPLQVQRALKWNEALIRIESRIAATDSKVFIIENGKMIGSFLLGQIKKVLPTNIKFVGFEKEKWPLLSDEANATSDVTVIIFAESADETTGIKIPVFAERRGIQLPKFVMDAIDSENQMTHVERRKALSLQKYHGFLKELESLGADIVVLQYCSNLDIGNLKGLLNNFKNISFQDFPEEILEQFQQKEVKKEVGRTSPKI
jgi:hypothetical protein